MRVQLIHASVSMTSVMTLEGPRICLPYPPVLKDWQLPWQLVQLSLHLITTAAQPHLFGIDTDMDSHMKILQARVAASTRGSCRAHAAATPWPRRIPYAYFHINARKFRYG